jgi:hypothetical protein
LFTWQQEKYTNEDVINVSLVLVGGVRERESHRKRVKNFCACMHVDEIRDLLVFLATLKAYSTLITFF